MSALVSGQSCNCPLSEHHAHAECAPGLSTGTLAAARFLGSLCNCWPFLKVAHTHTENSSACWLAHLSIGPRCNSRFFQSCEEIHQVVFQGVGEPLDNAAVAHAASYMHSSFSELCCTCDDCQDAELVDEESSVFELQVPRHCALAGFAK
eukprot:6457228-Amphidinium_carterae.1